MSVAAVLDEHIKPRRSVRHLRPVEPTTAKAKRRSPLFLTMVSLSAILGIFSAQLWLNLAVSKGAYEISSLEIQQRDLGRQERTLKLELDRLSSPQNLAQRATDLKMVQNTHPALLNLATMSIVGTAVATTEAPKGNLVENSALADLRLADEVVVVTAGMAAPAAAKQEQAEAVKQNTAAEAIPWEGKLVAPTTR